jgi:hypothetical protein
MVVQHMKMKMVGSDVEAEEFMPEASRCIFRHRSRSA